MALNERFQTSLSLSLSLARSLSLSLVVMHMHGRLCILNAKVCRFCMSVCPTGIAETIKNKAHKNAGNPQPTTTNSKQRQQLQQQLTLHRCCQLTAFRLLSYTHTHTHTHPYILTHTRCTSKSPPALCMRNLTIKRKVQMSSNVDS